MTNEYIHRSDSFEWAGSYEMSTKAASGGGNDNQGAGASHEVIKSLNKPKIRPG